jgi:DNA-binding LacI/PurR family transcriptional regulator
MRDLLEQDPQIEAVFASSDDIALGAMTAASQAGRRIPEDLALVGFDNIPQSAYFQPPLTTIDQPLSRMGRMAVEVLIKRIESRRGGKEDEPPTALMLEPRLVVRSSSRGF